MSPNCGCDRHDAVVLKAGERTCDGLYCLIGSVTVCRLCRCLLTGVAGSEYLNGGGHIAVITKGRGVFQTTRVGKERTKLIRQFARRRKAACA